MLMWGHHTYPDELKAEKAAYGQGTRLAWWLLNVRANYVWCSRNCPEFRVSRDEQAVPEIPVESPDLPR